MKMKWLGILFMAALLVSAPSYGSAQPSKDTSPANQAPAPTVKGEAAGSAKIFTPAERKAYEQQTAEELDAIQQKIAGVRMQATTGVPQKKRMLSQTANNLQMQKTAAEHELAVLKKASETAWGEQKAKLDKSMTGLRQAFEPAAIPQK